MVKRRGLNFGDGGKQDFDGIRVGWNNVLNERVNIGFIIYFKPRFLGIFLVILNGYKEWLPLRFLYE